MSKNWIFIVLIVMGCSQIPDRKVRIIGVLPFEDFPPQELPGIAQAIEQEYGLPVSILPPEKIPARFFINIKSPRYRADSIINYVRRIKPDSINIVLSLTEHDISTTKRDANGEIKKPSTKYADWGVFGLGYLPGESCVVSTFRIKGKGDGNVFRQRLRKVSLHEVGHNLGLPHCPDPACFMVDAAEAISTVDKAGEHLCAACKKRISA